MALGLTRLAGSLRVYTALLLLLLGAMPMLAVAVLLLPRTTVWPVATAAFRLTLRLAGVQVRAKGLEHLPETGHVLLMGNHVNWLDHLILVSLLRHPVAGFEKVENFRIPVYGFLMRRWGNVPVSRRSDPEEARRAGEAASRLLAQGVWFGMFPEGTRTRTGALGPFKKGGFHLAVDTGALIVPFAYRGAREVMATGRWWAMPGEVSVHFGAPIEASAYGKARLDALLIDTREAIKHLSAGAEAAGTTA
ncbi:MAG: lysophospholipid acyltransferase family protein [Candidatus Sericytochromatia bacterium]|nr:lysophospholipid acyltransferase family protein [Candidatus Sericytochromatia bacterium]